MFWFSMHHYEETRKFFADNSNFDINPFPLIWVKSPPMGLVPDAKRGPRRIYETCLFGSRGDHKIITPVPNAYAGPIDGSGHPSAKPEDMLRHFFPMFIDEYSRVLDPTCGSGTACASPSYWARRASWGSRSTRNSQSAPPLTSKSQCERPRRSQRWQWGKIRFYRFPVKPGSNGTRKFRSSLRRVLGPLLESWARGLAGASAQGPYQAFSVAFCEGHKICEGGLCGSTGTDQVPMSASGGKADIDRKCGHVRFGRLIRSPRRRDRATTAGK